MVEWDGMREDELMFHWGLGLAIVAIVLAAVLQVCSRNQDRARARARAQIVVLQQEIAESQARFSALVRPEVLRSIVIEMYPAFEPLGFKKTVSVRNLPQKPVEQTTEYGR
jgi:type II secretory pathway pseudopilin PulG